MLAFRALLRGIVDFAGLFPPAGLDMPSATRAYAEYRGGRTAWMLGRFALPASRLDEFAAARADLSPQAAGAGIWRLTATGGGHVAADVDAIRIFNRCHENGSGPGPVVDSYESRVSDPDEVAALAAMAGGDVAVACEVSTLLRHSGGSGNPGPDTSPDPDLSSLLDAVKSAGAVAKLRTGGVTPAAIPSSAYVAEFIWKCAVAGVPMKATAGLHHPVRSSQPLTYEPDSPVAVVHGFLNVFVAAAVAASLVGTIPDAEGMATLTEVLEEDDPAIFTFDDERLGWRGRHLTVAAITAARSVAALSFGSCSFEEPIADLRRLGFKV